MTCISQANGSAVRLVSLIVEMFPCFRDEIEFGDKTIHFYKRAQILVADLWACFGGKGFGKFEDIHEITMFAGMVCGVDVLVTQLIKAIDYRVPQMLHTLGCLKYSPRLAYHVRQLQPIQSGHTWEIELRGKFPSYLFLISR